MPNSWVDVPVDGQVMDAYLTKPNDEEKHPAVIVIQEVWGVNSHIQYVTDRLPAAGYVGLAPSMFHREGRMIMGMHEEMETAFARMGCLHRREYRGRCQGRRCLVAAAALRRPRPHWHRRVLFWR